MQRESSTREWNAEEKKFGNEGGREKGMVRRKSNREERNHLVCNVVTAVKRTITTWCQICPLVSVWSDNERKLLCRAGRIYAPVCWPSFSSSFPSEWSCFVPGTFPNPWHLATSTRFPSAAPSVQINRGENCVRFWLLFCRMKTSVKFTICAALLLYSHLWGVRQASKLPANSFLHNSGGREKF